MRAGFSEFTYAYALLDSLSQQVLSHGKRLVPIFPTTRQEARLGYDVKLDWGMRGTPLFLQFKVSEHMIHTRATGWSKFGEEFYKFKVWSRARSDQHQLLLDLDARHGNVFYVAPHFHQESEMTDYFLNGTVGTNSFWIRPSAVGSFDPKTTTPNSKMQDHHVAFLRGKPVYRFSEPQLIPGGYFWGLDELEQVPLGDSLEQSLLKARNTMLSLISGEKTNLLEDPRTLLDEVQYRHLEEADERQTIAIETELLARHYFGCATIILNESH